ncbi:MAG: MBL fold metallo-hydrolase [Pedobacter sp.]
MISITNFKAGFGDTYLIEIFPNTDKPVRILIDCGFEFMNNAIPALTEIGETGGKIDRFIITHYDSDHIASASNFIKANGESTHTTIIPIDQIWLNTFRHLQFSKRLEIELTTTEFKILSAFISDFGSKVSKNIPDKAIGAKQAMLLGQEILKMGYNWNTDFQKRSACIEFNPDVVISENVYLHLLSPNLKNLAALEKKFVQELQKMNIGVKDDSVLDDAFELYNRWLEQQEVEEKSISGTVQNITKQKIIDLTTNYVYEKDKAPGNGSSIAFIIRTPEKQLLFLADAHSEDIIEQLTLRYKNSTQYPILFDAVKVAHHGSFKNNKPDLFQMVDSEKFLFSTNGKHAKHVHPDVETVIHIINRPLPKGMKLRTLYFNHDLDHLKFLKEEGLQKEFKFTVCYDLHFSV